MIKNLLFLVACAFLFFGCQKEDKTTLIGVWITEPNEPVFLQYTIQNIDGIGKDVNFKKQNDSLFLFFLGEIVNYKIEKLSKSNLVLSIKNKKIIFRKVQ